MNTPSHRPKARIVIERTYKASLEDIWNLWTTKEGFESWWGPQGFRVAVHELDARAGGVLRYDMIAAAPETITAMQRMGQPTTHGVVSRFSEVTPRSRIVLTNIIDFLPGVDTYESNITVDFHVNGSTVRMVTTLDGMHDDATTRMQEAGYTSQLTKLDARFAA